MNHAERVKGLAAKYALGFTTQIDYARRTNELHTEIDAMQSALDEAVAKLAARDAEVERLRADLLCAQELLARLQGLADTAIFMAEVKARREERAISLAALSEEVKGGE